MTLRRVVELAGMSEHCDFTEQADVTGERGRCGPTSSCTCRKRAHLVVDAKTPLDAYLDAIEARRNAARRARRHAQQVEKRVRELG